MFQESKKICSRTAEEELFECAELVLPWLPLSDLASMSSTCKSLRQIAKAITTRRIFDASRSLEKHPIPFINTVDAQPYSYFIYTPSQILGLPDSSPIYQPWGSNPKIPISNSCPMTDLNLTIGLVSSVVENCSGCVCKNCSRVTKDGDLECPCWSIQPELMGSCLVSEMMTECGSSCVCGLDCANRLTQQGVSVRLKIVKHRRKGWGVEAAQFIGCGKFICEYAGELLTTEEARKRQQKYDELSSSVHFSSALLVVREHLPSGKACMRVNIDATRVGNIARFINHSCDGGNLMTVLVRSSGMESCGRVLFKKATRTC
ncbi:PREDICTED: histone-lysine N-methyltransferase SUVR3 isoform X2 [Nelumbo nucifera]|uniref:Histone-lysine N-methyltransferase SUVR3 isoform X2 n=1 Tax=Nelumbo nucifera TaxID=4432 RepID=A0A1U7YZG9_NELNU|nr:PREDICTED: histone-lysine N-methyltransferase SUVR3 isoform X2 [Nelumbo nucifera]